MTSNELIESLRANGGDRMWVEQAVELVAVLRGSSVDPRSPTLLGDMNAERFAHPRISDWLYKLPGHRAGDMAAAERHLSYLTMQINAASASFGGARDDYR